MSVKINKEIALSNLFYFAKYVCGKARMQYDPHYWLSRFIQDWGPNRKKIKPDLTHYNYQFHFSKEDRVRNKLVLLPRKGFKSTDGAVCFPLWMLVQPEESPYTLEHLRGKGGNRNMRILLDSEVRNKISLRNLNDIKGILQKPLFVKMFGKMRPEVGWKEDQIIISLRQPGIFGEPSIIIGGVDIEETGMAFDLIVPDDLCGRTNVNTQDQLEKVVRHFQDYGSLLDKGGLLLCLGTFWHHQDYYHYILENPEILAQFDVIRWPAKDEQGKFLFPQELNEKKLAEEKAKQGSHFYPQYMLEVTAGEDAIIDKADLRYFKVVDGEIWIQQEGAYRPKGLKISDLTITLTCDEAHTKAKYADYMGINVKGEDKEGNWYILISRRGRWSESEGLNEIEISYQTYPINQGGLESDRYELLAEQLSRRGIYIKELKHRLRSKYSRFRALEPRFARHKIYIQKSQGNLEYEILCWMSTGFRGTHDDESDALAYQADLGTFTVQKEKRISWVNYSDPMTGY